MKAVPEPAHSPQLPTHLLTVREYVELDEDDQHRWELLEGTLLMSPFAKPSHMYASARLLTQLEAHLPAKLVVLQETDIDLELVPPDRPGTVRRADLVVVDDDAYRRVDDEGGFIRASEVRLVIEIVSPGSQRMDRIVKRDEYADARIPYYWIVDLDEPVSLLPLHFAHDDLGYAEDGEVSGDCAVDGPFPVTLRLDELAR